MTITKRRCEQRLRREFLALQESPVENCAAAPLDDNILEWHVNIMSPHPEMLGVCFHFIVEYPNGYPARAPKIRPVTYISHQNVFGDYICLDILTMSEETAKTPYRGWSSAYTISTLLVQLQCFLFENKLNSYRRERMITEATQHVCRSCGHSILDDNICPEVDVTISNLFAPGTFRVCADSCMRLGREFDTDIVRTVKKREKVQVLAIVGRRAQTPDGWVSLYCSEGVCLERLTVEKTTRKEDAGKLYVEYYISELFEMAQMDIFEFCDLETLHMLCEVNDDFRRVIEKVFTLQERQFRCFYTLKDLETHKEEGIIFGVGAEQFRMDKYSRATGRKNFNVLQQLHPSFDYMSWEAYNKCGVRTNVWKDRELDVFIPLYINNAHGQRALNLAEKQFTQMWDKLRFTPQLALDTLAMLMNTTVVDMMKLVDDLEVGELQMVDSIKALEGYMSFHHLLLAFVDRYPNLKEIANYNVGNFINDPQYRDKEVTPDMGQLLVQCAISDHTWDEFLAPWLSESFQRNARWCLAKFPNLLQIETKDFSCIRMHQLFRTARTGLRLAMFQRFFLENIASPPELDSDANKFATIFKTYNKRFGKPENGLAQKLQDHSRMVLDCDNWFDYFELMGFPCPTSKMFCKWLKNAQQLSEMRQYHKPHNILKYRQHWLESSDYNFHMDACNCICSGRIFQIKNDGCPKVTQKAPLVEKKQRMDIVFCIDCTGSMSSWISVVKRNVKEMIRTIARDAKRKIRFGIVAYRDHEGEGWDKNDKYVTRVHNFSNDVKIVKSRVDGLRAGGGADYPEAMCCALRDCHELSWDREANQIIILIGDAPPHGLGVGGDTFPEGCPCGSDSIRVIKTMAKQGVVFYPIDCGHSDAIRQTFFHAAARMTGGICLNLRDATKLPEIVLGAALEEKAMDELAVHIRPILKEKKKRHAIAREEQVLFEVYSQMKAKEIQVETMLPSYTLDETAEHQIESIVFCEDLNQARAIIKGDHFIPINTSSITWVNEKKGRVVTQEQVKKCIKRIKFVDDEAEVMLKGCQYRQDRWRLPAYQERWNAYIAKSKNANLTTFKPWQLPKDAFEKAKMKIKTRAALERKTRKRKPVSVSLNGWSTPNPVKTTGRQPAAPKPEPVPEHAARPIEVAKPEPRPAAPRLVQPRPAAPQPRVQPQPAVRRTVAPRPMAVHRPAHQTPALVIVPQAVYQPGPNSFAARPLPPVSHAPPRAPHVARASPRRTPSQERRDPASHPLQRSVSKGRPVQSLRRDHSYEHSRRTSVSRSAERISPAVQPYSNALFEDDTASKPPVVSRTVDRPSLEPVLDQKASSESSDSLRERSISTERSGNIHFAKPAAYGTLRCLRVRKEYSITSETVGSVNARQVVRVVEIVGHRARIVAPVSGWLYTHDDKGNALIQHINESQITRPANQVPVEGTVPPAKPPAPIQRPVPAKPALEIAPVSQKSAPLVEVEAPVVCKKPTLVFENVSRNLTPDQLASRLSCQGIFVKHVVIKCAADGNQPNIATVEVGSHFYGSMALRSKIIADGMQLRTYWLPAYIETRASQV